MITQWSSDDAPSIFRIRTRDVDAIGDGNGYFDVYVAIGNSATRNLEALEAARNLIHSPQWWDERLVTAVERVGSLWALEAKEPV